MSIVHDFTVNAPSASLSMTDPSRIAISARTAIFDDPPHEVLLQCTPEDAAELYEQLGRVVAGLRTRPRLTLTDVAKLSARWPQYERVLVFADDLQEVHAAMRAPDVTIPPLEGLEVNVGARGIVSLRSSGTARVVGREHAWAAVHHAWALKEYGHASQARDVYVVLDGPWPRCMTMVMLDSGEEICSDGLCIWVKKTMTENAPGGSADGNP